MVQCFGCRLLLTHQPATSGLVHLRPGVRGGRARVRLSRIRKQGSLGSPTEPPPARNKNPDVCTSSSLKSHLINHYPRPDVGKAAEYKEKGHDSDKGLQE